MLGVPIWLLLLFYQRDYQAGGMPSLFDRFDRRQVVSVLMVVDRMG